MKGLKLIAVLICLSLVMPSVVIADNNSNDPFKDKSEISIAFIGGSITEGVGSTGWVNINSLGKSGQIENPKSYAGLVGKYFKDKYPDKKVNIYNAGLSGTTSWIGLFRLKEEVIEYNPDIVFIEFAINDRNYPEDSKTYMEAIVRQLLSMEKEPIINFVYTTNKEFKACSSAQNVIADYYGIPVHDIQAFAKKQCESGRLKTTDFLSDGTHPNDAGHAMYANFIINNLKKRDGSFLKAAQPREKSLAALEFKKPEIISYTRGKISGEWTNDNVYGRKVIASFTPGSTIEFKFYGKVIGAFHTCGTIYKTADYVVDDKIKGTVPADGASLSANLYLDNLEEGWHTIKLTVKEVGFGIAGFFVDEANKPEENKQSDDENPVYTETESGKYELFISNSGSDSGDGSKNAPFLTVTKALDVISIMRKTINKGEITVYFRRGTYNVADGININQSVSGTNNLKIIFSAFEDEEVILTNGVKLESSSFVKVSDEAVKKKLPKNARENIYVTDIKKQGITDLGIMSRDGGDSSSSPMLIVNQRLQTIARWPNRGFASVKEVLYSGTGVTYSINENKIKDWLTAKNAWVKGLFRWLWADDTLQVKSMDVSKKAITTVHTPGYGILADHPWYILNLLEELDSPGEWYLDRENGKLYYYPVDEINQSDFRFVTSASTLITINKADFITFENFIIDGTCGNGIEINNGKNNLFTNCIVRHIGNAAAKVINGKNNGFTSSHYYDIGKGGIYFSGGDFINLTPSGNYVENCHIERVSIFKMTYTAAVSMYGVGDRVSHCRINNGEHYAIRFEGNNNIIEYNEFYNYVKYSDDMGVIYGGRTWVSGGTVIRYNYIHDCTSEAGEFTQGIYLDDGFSGATIYGNVFSGLSNGIFIHYGRSNKIYNNMFLNCSIAVEARNPGGQKDPEVLKKNEILIEEQLKNGTINTYKQYNLDTLYKLYAEKYNPNNSVWNSLYPYLKDILNSKCFYPMDNDIQKNSVFGKTAFLYPDSVADNIIIKNNYQSERLPEYQDEENYNYNITDLTEVLKNIEGFEPLDITKCGINGDYRSADNGFKALFPANGETNIEAKDCILGWEYMNGVNQYRLTVAKDKDFNEIVFDDIVKENYKRFTNLRYDMQKYYWKVTAYPNLYSFGKDYRRENENGVMSFRTAKKESVFTEDLENAIKLSQTTYDNAIEGDDSGKYFVGSKEAFLPHLKSARDTLNTSKKKQAVIDKAYSQLNKQLNTFTSSVHSETIKINDMLSDKEKWKGNKNVFLVSNDSVESSQDVQFGYMGRKLENNQILSFKAKLAPGESWVSFGLRCSNPAIVPWNANCYIFLVKKNVLELQKFNGDKKFYFKVDNNYIQPDVIYDITFGAVTTPDGVKLTVTVDGTEVFNYLDKEYPVTEKGYFSVCNSGSSKFTIYKAD